MISTIWDEISKYFLSEQVPADPSPVRLVEVLQARVGAGECAGLLYPHGLQEDQCSAGGEIY